MDIITYATEAIAVLCCVVVCAMYCGKTGRLDESPRHEDLALRNSAAFALSCYWSRYYEGWSLVLFRDVSGAIRHVGCETPNGKFFDASGYCSEEQITQRIGAHVTAENGEETDVQALLGTNNAVLEAAEDLRHRVEH